MKNQNFAQNFRKNIELKQKTLKAISKQEPLVFKDILDLTSSKLVLDTSISRSRTDVIIQQNQKAIDLKIQNNFFKEDDIKNENIQYNQFVPGNQGVKTQQNRIKKSKFIQHLYSHKKECNEIQRFSSWDDGLQLLMEQPRNLPNISVSNQQYFNKKHSNNTVFSNQAYVSNLMSCKKKSLKPQFLIQSSVINYKNFVQKRLQNILSKNNITVDLNGKKLQNDLQ